MEQQPRVINVSDKCEYLDCDALAVELVNSRDRGRVEKLCKVHADVVIREYSPEYVTHCPNCGCGDGIN